MDINRKTAYNTLFEMEKNGAYSNIALNQKISELKPDSPAFVRELVYGVTENKIYIDYVLNQLIPNGLKGIKKQTLTLLRMGLYQIIFMDSVPDYAAVSETVKIARRAAPGREGFINGVLRGYNIKREGLDFPDAEKNPVEYLSVMYSFEPWIVKLWMAQYGVEKTEELLRASNETPQISIRVNLMKTSVEELGRILIDNEFEVKNGKLSERVLHVKGSGLLNIPEYERGFFSVQDESSVLASETMAVKPGETVLDICAAPGGKSLAMAEIMGNRGIIKAFDVYDHKLELIEKEKSRLGLSIIEVLQGDGTVFDKELAESADKVLIDAPCSGLGVIRRKPEIKYKKIEDDGRELAKKQYEILNNAYRYVKRGGFIVYSTCTVNIIENREVVGKFLRNHKEYELIRSRQLLPGTEGTDGFFICKMKRRI